MDILLWLVPSAVITVLAMAWVAFLGREGREEDREEVVRRLGIALENAKTRERSKKYAAPQPPLDRSTGLAVRVNRDAS
ncbi:hypothetical protein [Nocardioides albus]|uniref:Cytochrome c-type biogenesis protein CcmH/NrfF n=1 Tax=Nocardioides albus TaxID=1841 RepID=A0A7W5F845_9ACTN|nr:hypothetical protein [Nocardioides albus]MBB3088661.1 cytochrome c-type biogenesis protein CcmH/NrfF [Nocardioides albus]GGU17706.1 hypothetical protein GCM10007979_15540 [Nocardioides albus]